MGDCVFCKIIAREAPADIVAETHWSYIIIPLNPVVSGHLIVLPKEHKAHALNDPPMTARVMQDAVEWVMSEKLDDKRYESVNFITSVGKPATQSVFHLHIHIIPRAHGDGLALPWTGQER